MPVFEFHCPACDHQFEELVRSIRNIRAVACPSCGGGKVHRKVSVFSAHAGPAKKNPACGLPAGTCGQFCGLDGACEG